MLWTVRVLFLMYGLQMAETESRSAHEDAFKSGVLHWDVSAGNIILVDGGGLLIDWDLCKHIGGEKGSGARRTMCTVRAECRKRCGRC